MTVDEKTIKEIDMMNSVKRIGGIRASNQGWMELLSLALELDEERAKVILRGIVEKDKRVVAVCEEILGD
jgi:hypothetical protein